MDKELGLQGSPCLEEGKFCWHIKPFAGHLMGGEPIGGAAGWFVRLHLGQCRSCQAALAALLALRDRLRALQNAPASQESDAELDTKLEPNRWAAMEAAWAKAERKRDG